MSLPFAALLLIWVQDPAEEEETRAASHLKAGALLEKDPDTSAEALYHFDRVIDTCAAASDAERHDARKRANRIRGRVPGNTDEAKAAPIRALVVVPRNYNFRIDKRSIKHRVPDSALQQVRKGFEAFERAVFEATRGAVRIDAQIMALDDEIRAVRPDGDDVWIHPEDFQINHIPNFKDGEYDFLILYLFEAEGLSFTDDAKSEPNVRGARYINFRWSKSFLETNAPGGAREFQAWLWWGADMAWRRGGWRVVGPPDLNQMKNDGCWDGPKNDGADLAPWRRHYAEAHFTAQMWREIAARPQASFTRTWRLSPRYENRDDKGLAESLIPESNEDLELKAWEVAQSKADVVDLLPFARGNPKGVIYAATYVYAKKKQWVKLFLGEDASAKVLLNGQQVYLEHEHRGVEVDRRCIRLFLKEGRNLLLIKVENNADQWAFCARLTDLVGMAPKVDINPVRK